jgi:phage antirepressor YoqD-like protein
MTIDYGGSAFRVVKGNGKNEGRISLKDVCAAIRRPEMLKNAMIRRLCPSLTGEPGGDDWADFKDAKRVLEYAHKSIWGRQRVVSMFPLVNALIEEEEEETGRQADRAQDSGEFSLEYGGSTFRARRQGERLMFNATEMTKPYGKAPFLWTNLNTTKKLVEYVVDNGFAEDSRSLIVSTPGRYGHTWIDHTLLVHLGRWLSDDFGAWCERMLSDRGLYRPEIATVVFESPRRTRMARTPAASAKRREAEESRAGSSSGMPQSLDEARALLAELRPKATYYDEQVESRKWFPNSFIANELGITIRQLNMFLEDAGVQERRDDKWVVSMTYRAVPLKTDVPYDNPNAVNRSNMRSVWTPYGREFVHDLWNGRRV